MLPYLFISYCQLQKLKLFGKLINQLLFERLKFNT